MRQHALYAHQLAQEILWLTPNADQHPNWWSASHLVDGRTGYVHDDISYDRPCDQRCQRYVDRPCRLTAHGNLNYQTVQRSNEREIAHENTTDGTKIQSRRQTQLLLVFSLNILTKRGLPLLNLGPLAQLGVVTRGREPAQ